MHLISGRKRHHFAVFGFCSKCGERRHRYPAVFVKYETCKLPRRRMYNNITFAMYLVSGQICGRLNYLKRVVTSSGMCVEDLYAPSGDGRVTSFIERIRVTPRDCMGPTSGNIFQRNDHMDRAAIFYFTLGSALRDLLTQLGFRSVNNLLIVYTRRAIGKPSHRSVEHGASPAMRISRCGYDIKPRRCFFSKCATVPDIVGISLCFTTMFVPCLGHWNVSWGFTCGVLGVYRA